jgi:hypothetical protein
MQRQNPSAFHSLFLTFFFLFLFFCFLFLFTSSCSHIAFVNIPPRVTWDKRQEAHLFRISSETILILVDVGFSIKFGVGAESLSAGSWQPPGADRARLEPAAPPLPRSAAQDPCSGTVTEENDNDEIVISTVRSRSKSCKIRLLVAGDRAKIIYF